MEDLDEKIIKTEYSEVMQKSFIDYAMSVIVARALPDVRDGLKPVQRRTLYDMYELGIRYDRPYRKCARIVGDTMGKYHPHGDSSIYDALVVMAQDFKKGLPLVDGHGNFGNIEGDGAAAMRYTEARLEQVTQEAFLGDLDKDVVDFGPNFDETEKEPLVLPVKIPNLLVNGSEGIAVGMATSIPSHNLGEVIEAEKAFLKSYRDRLCEIPNSYSSFSVYIKFKQGAHRPFANHPCYFQEEHGYVWQLCDYDEESFPRGFMYLTPPTRHQGPWADRMTVNCPMPFSAVSRWADSVTGHRPPDYEAWKEHTLQRVLDKLERVCPGLRADIDFCFASTPLTIRDYYGTKEGALYGYNRDCQNMALSQLPVATKVRNLLLTGQNLNLHGICGVPLTAIETAEALVGRGTIVRKINEAYERKNL